MFGMCFQFGNSCHLRLSMKPKPSITQLSHFLSQEKTEKVFHYNDNRYRCGVKPSATRFTRKNGPGEQEATSSDLCTERVEEEAIRSQQNTLSTQRSKYDQVFLRKPAPWFM